MRLGYLKPPSRASQVHLFGHDEKAAQVVQVHRRPIPLLVSMCAKKYWTSSSHVRIILPGAPQKGNAASRWTTERLLASSTK